MEAHILIEVLGHVRISGAYPEALSITYFEMSWAAFFSEYTVTPIVAVHGRNLLCLQKSNFVSHRNPKVTPFQN
jgi:hypothetical protein